MTVGLFRLGKRGYDFPPYRPPSESGSLLVRVTRGCTWNKCTFCSMYKGMKFQRRPLDEIRRDLESAAALCRDEVATVFLGDSNSLVLHADSLVDILTILSASFPGLQRVTSYARARTLLKKSADDLQRIRRAGLTRLHVGLETGSAALLKDIRKGATAEEFVKAGRLVKQAGFELSLYVLLGLGGEERWREHAAETAAVLNRIDPHFIRVRTVQPQPGSQLYDDMRSGVFTRASHATVFAEQRMLVAGLEVTSHYLSDHISNYIPVNGRLPHDRQAMLKTIDDSIARMEHDPAMRRSVTHKDTLRRL